MMEIEYSRIIEVLGAIGFWDGIKFLFKRKITKLDLSEKKAKELALNVRRNIDKCVEQSVYFFTESITDEKRNKLEREITHSIYSIATDLKILCQEKNHGYSQELIEFRKSITMELSSRPFTKKMHNDNYVSNIYRRGHQLNLLVVGFFNI